MKLFCRNRERAALVALGSSPTLSKPTLKPLGADPLDGARAYLAGPPPMVEAGVEIFRAAGLDQARIHADAFYTEAEKAALTGA